MADDSIFARDFSDERPDLEFIDLMPGSAISCSGEGHCKDQANPALFVLHIQKAVQTRG
jgi:hypothetical protein